MPLLLRRGVCDRRKMERNGSMQRCRAGERRARRKAIRAGNGGGGATGGADGATDGDSEERNGFCPETAF